MATVRSIRTMLSRLADAGSARAAVGKLAAPVVIYSNRSFHSSFPSPAASGATAASWRSLLSPSVFLSAGMGLFPPGVIFNIQSRSFAKRAKKWQGGPYAFVQVEDGVPVLPYQPNEGSVKNRKHKKRMAQRDAFAKAQAQKRKAETKVAVIARDAARRKRWREGAARARDWARHCAKIAAEQEAKTVTV